MEVGIFLVLVVVIIGAAKILWNDRKKFADPETYFKSIISKFEENIHTKPAYDNSYVCLIYFAPLFALFKSDSSIFYHNKKAILLLFSFLYPATYFSQAINQRDRKLISAAIEPVFEFFTSFYGIDAKKFINLQFVVYADALSNQENIVEIFTGVMDEMLNADHSIFKQLEIITETNAMFVEFVPMISEELKEWCKRKDFAIRMGYEI